MGVFDDAMQMEKDGEQYYRGLAGESPDKGLATILTMLADEEVKHFNILKAMKAGGSVQVDGGTVRQDVKNVFQKLQDSGEKFDFTVSQVDAYKKAQEIERKSREFYQQRADETGSPAAKEAFLKIADEEHLHYQMLDTMVEYISRAEPGGWLESAEWHHTDEY